MHGPLEVLLLLFLSTLLTAQAAPPELRSVERQVRKGDAPAEASTSLVLLLKDRTLTASERRRVRLALARTLDALDLKASAMAQALAVAKEGASDEHADALRHVAEISVYMDDFHDVTELLDTPVRRPGRKLARLLAWVGCEEGAVAPRPVDGVTGWAGLVAAEEDELARVLREASDAYRQTTGGWLQRQHDALSTERPRHPRPLCR